jgi:glycosyltransferase involved in cell wall biosynthesis
VSKSLPLVSIVTPSLNQGRFIESTIRSVLEQDYPRLEHIVVDGGSTDETLAVLRRYQHLRWISERDGGQSEALNKGFALAEGEILGWLNADDIYLPGAIAAAVQEMRDTGCALVYGGWTQLDEAGNVFREISPTPWDYGLQLEARNGVSQPGTLFTREALESVGGIDNSYRYAMDYDLWLRIGMRFGARHVDQVWGVQRLHDDAKTTRHFNEFWPERLAVSRRYGARLVSPLLIRRYVKSRNAQWLAERAVGATYALVGRRAPRSSQTSGSSS